MIAAAAVDQRRHRCRTRRRSPVPSTTVAERAARRRTPGPATGLPTGLTINPATGVISGTPTATGTFAASAVTLTDAAAASVTKTFSITISPLPTVTSVSPTSARPRRSEPDDHDQRNRVRCGPSLAAVFSNPGITVVSTTRVTANQLTAVINVSAAAATGAGTVTVTNGDGGAATNSVAFTVNAATDDHQHQPGNSYPERLVQHRDLRNRLRRGRDGVVQRSRWCTDDQHDNSEHRTQNHDQRHAGFTRTTGT